MVEHVTCAVVGLVDGVVVIVVIAVIAVIAVVHM
jgi:hypothetical protein